MKNKVLFGVVGAMLSLGAGISACDDGDSKCFLDNDCYKSGDNDGTLVCNRTTGKCDKTPKGMCTDGIKNNTETDVDCGGGVCSACDTNKACTRGDDCKSLTCTGNVCTGTAMECEAPADGDLIINEVFASPNPASKMEKFASCPSVDQNEFIEIINTSTKAIDMMGVVINENDSERYKFTKKRCVLPKHAVVVYATAVCERDGVYSELKGSDFPLTNDARDIKLIHNNSIISFVSNIKADSGVSTQRNPDISGPDTLILHTAVNANLAQSPGLCANGLPLATDCQVPAHCNNSTKDGDETDLDCGGSCLQKCANDKSCKQASDCESGKCGENLTCTPPECAIPSAGQLLINEILTAPGKVVDADGDTVVDSDKDRFVEIVNTSEQKLSLAGVKIIQGETLRYTFDNELCLSPKAGIVVFNNTDSTASTAIKQALGVAGNIEILTTKAFAPSQSGDKTFTLQTSSGALISSATLTSTSANCAQQRKPDYGTNDNFVSLNTIAEGVCASAGLCSTGGELKPGCAQIPPSCDDGIKNQDETDIDCGGLTCDTRCGESKECTQHNDCLSQECDSNNLCTEPPVYAKPAANEFIINEVMGSPNTSQDFANCPGVKQSEFIEFVNVSKQPLSLEGVKLYLTKEGGAETEKHTFGPVIVNPSHAVVLIDSDTHCDNSEVTWIHKGVSITNGSDYSYKLKLDDVEIAAASHTKDSSGYSMQRNPDLTGADALIKHSDVSATYANSPGTCADGSKISDGCPAPLCKNSTINPEYGETDVDCGGSNCTPCGDNKACNENSDCQSEICTDNVCTPPPTYPAPTVGQVIINEVMGSPNTLQEFANCSGVKQNEFMEFVNVSDTTLNLEGVELYSSKDSATKVLKHTFPRTVLKSKQALVIYQNTACGIPDVVELINAGALGITNSADYTYTLELGTTTITSASHGKVSTTGKSMQRNPDLTGPDALVTHLNTTCSPGACSDSTKSFTSDCL